MDKLSEFLSETDSGLVMLATMFNHVHRRLEDFQQGTNLPRILFLVFQ